jgi:predicted dehydrogenase/threonine dehydrogenase-like Zn-dependent dehydrogenase
MKQLLQNMRNGRSSVVEVPVPVAQPGTALVQTAASLVSAGTERMVVDFAKRSLVGKARSRPDLVRQVMERARREGLLNAAQTALKRLDQPLALGYSSAGTIAALGAGMPGFKVGQRVACAGGGYAVHAEYAVVPRNLLATLPPSVDFESGAFATLGAIGMHGFRLARPQVGESVAVLGLGLLGLLTIQIAAAAGCTVFGVDVDPARVRLAASLGLPASVRSKAGARARNHSGNRGFDVVLICADTVSNDPVQFAAEIARDRARVVAIGAVGLNLPRRPYYEKELAFINSRSYGPGRYDPAYEEFGRDYPVGYVRWTEGRNLQAVVDLIAAGKLLPGPLITHRFPIGQARRAYDLVAGPRARQAVGVLLTYAPGAASRRSKIEFASVGAAAGPVRLGVLGAGKFADATLLPAVKKAGGIAAVGIASPGGLHAEHAARKFGFAYASSSADDILKDSHINTVAILSRHDSHADLAISALKHRKHVFVEKPLAIDSAQLSRLSRQIRLSRKVLLTVGFNRRFSPMGRMLAEVLADRTEPLHAHYRINAGYLPLDHWTQDPALGGRLIGEACHFVDFIAFLVGAVPTTVTARALPDLGRYREDNASLTLEFPDGSIGVVDYLSNGDASFPKERLEVFCASRIAVLDDFRSLTMVHAGTTKVLRRPQDKGWVNEWRVFGDSIREGGAPPIPYEQLLGVTAAMLAAVESLRTGRPVPVRSPG